MLLRLLVVLVLAFAPVLPARADNVADEAELRFRRAAEHYSKGRLDDALSEFFVSNRLAPNRNVVFNIARTYEQLGRLEEAFRYYNDLASEDWAEDDRKALDAALLRLRPKVALVRVESEPPGAEVFIERENLGARGLSPRTIALPAGKTKVIVKLDGFRTASVDTELRRGHEETVRIPLERIWSVVEVSTSPQGAELRVGSLESEAQCVTPCRVQVLPGSQALYFTVPGHLPLRRDVELVPDATLALNLTLDKRPPPVGKVVVQANRQNALVKIDGVEAGFTPVVLDAVVVGRHEVEVSYPELTTSKTVIEVVEGRSSIVEARLSVPSPTVSAAAKSLGSADDTAASVTVIGADEIRTMGWQTLAQALRAVRGLYLSNDRTYESLGVRGFHPLGDLNTRVLVLVNGHPYNDVWAGQAGIGTDFDVDLSQVERIEVVRGPNSALYGSAAVFGVINVVHRMTPRSGAVELRATGGNQGTGKARVSAGIERESWGASVSVAGHRSENTSETLLDLPGDVRPATVRGLDGDSARHLQVLARAGDFRLVAVHNDRSKELPTGPFGSLLGASGTRARDRRTFVEGRYEHAFDSGLELTARGYWDQVRYDGSFRYDDGVSRDADRADWAGAEARVRTGSLGGHRLSAGLEAQQWLSVKQQVVSNEQVLLDDERSATVLSAYLADDWRLHRKLKAEMALRADMYSGAVEQFALAPRGALLGNFYEGGITKLAVGRAFRVPNIYERYYSDGGQSQKVPDPGSLRPEVILQAELEHTHRLDEDILLTAGLFGSRLTDLLSLEEDTDGLLVYRSGDEPIFALGGELEVRWQPSRLQLLSFSYSYQYSLDPGSSQPQALVNSPRHLAALRGMQPIVRAAAVGFELVWNAPRLGRDGRRYGESLLASVALSGDIERFGLHYSLSAQNLFNEQYSLPVGDDISAYAVPQYGRTLQLTVAKSFF